MNSHRDGETDYWRYRRTEAGREFRAARDLLLTHRTDYRRAYELFRWPRPATFNWALEWFDVVAAERAGSALELVGGPEPERVSWAELSSRSDAVAVWLREQGVTRGDRVLVVLDARRELWETLLACLKLGAVVIPTYATLTAAEASDRVRRGRIRAVVCAAPLTERFAGCVDGLLRVAVPGAVPGWRDYTEAAGTDRRFLPDGPTPAGAVAFAYFTSGTTDRPKLVAHTHTSYPVGHLSSMYWNGLRPGDLHLNVSAPGWAKHSWSSFFVPWNAEATILAPRDGAARPETLPGILARHGADSFCAPPSTWTAMVPHLHAAVPRLREATSAGEPMDPAVAEAVRAAWSVSVRDGYGQTETTALVGTPPGVAPRPGWLGLQMPGYRIGLHSEDTEPAEGPGGETGEVCVDLAGGPAGVMAGYLDEPERTRAAMAAGRYRTGDVGERAADGWIRVHGRRDDVFKSFDHRISPYELEAVLRRHPGVAEVAVVARPHPIGGSVPHAVVVASPGRVPTADELLAHAAGQLAPALRPRSVEFAESLPRTRSGKVRRAALTAHSPEQP